MANGFFQRQGNSEKELVQSAGADFERLLHVRLTK